MRTMYFVAAVAAMLAMPAMAQAPNQTSAPDQPRSAPAQDRTGDRAPARSEPSSPDRRTYHERVERERALHRGPRSHDDARQLPPTPESIARGNGYADRMGASVRYGRRGPAYRHASRDGYGRVYPGGYRAQAPRHATGQLYSHRHWVGHHHRHGYWAGRSAVRSAYWPRRAGYWHGYRGHYPAGYSVAPSYPVEQEQDYGYAAPAETYPVAPAPTFGTGCGCRHGW